MVVVVVMTVPVIVPMAVTLVLGVMTVLITPSGHKHLKVLRTVGMVVIFAEGPVVQQRVSGKQPRLRAFRILYWCAPRVVVEVIEQLGVDPAQRNTACLLYTSPSPRD